MKFKTLTIILLTALVSTSAWSKDSEKKCLVDTIYHEARGESTLGMKAVAYVTLNRVKDPRFPNTICSVVYQKHQFSWTSMGLGVTEKVAYQKAEEIAEEVLQDQNLEKDPTNGALYFENIRLTRKDRNNIIIGNHSFHGKRK